MSHEVDDYYTSYEELLPRARKEHECDACDAKIRKGDRYARIFIRDSEGDASTVKRCLRCQRIHEHLRKLGSPDNMWPAERLDCGEEYEEHWGAPPPDELAKLAFMTDDEAQRELVPSVS